jgi:hypothetical protein
MSEPLSDDLRRTLESTVKKAREVAEDGARSALEALAVHRPEPFPHLDPDQRALRRRLRAHGRQQGDRRRPDGLTRPSTSLVQETAYEHWHRMLFARFLAENGLLMHPDGVPLTLDECNELAHDEGAADGWELAGRYASRMLPQIFRPDSPVLSSKARPGAPARSGEAAWSSGSAPRTASRPPTASAGSTSSGRPSGRIEVNASEVKIGADELPAVTQLFTEPYMVAVSAPQQLSAPGGPERCWRKT